MWINLYRMISRRGSRVWSLLQSTRCLDRLGKSSGGVCLCANEQILNPKAKIYKMPRYAKKTYPRRKRAGRRRVARRRPAPTGFIKLVRKCPEITIANTAVAGAYTITDPTTNCLMATGTGLASGFLGTFNIPFALKFSLNQILNSGELTTLCDKYMLKKTVVRIYYNSNNNSILSASSLPQLSYVLEDDDAAIPAPNDVREKMGCKIRYFNNKNMIQMTIYPKPTSEVFNTSLSGSGYSPGKQLWIDAAYPSVEHYGVKAVLQNVTLPTTANTVGFKWDVTHTIYGKDFQ